MKRKNTIVFLLLLLALAIWGHNGYRMLKGLQLTSEDGVPENVDAGEAKSDTSHTKTAGRGAFVYRADLRDPFAHWVQERKPHAAMPTHQSLPARAQAPTPPRLRLSGIIHDARGVLAVLESPEGEIHFAKSKDVIAGVEILAIASASVTCRFAKVRYEIPLE